MPAIHRRRVVSLTIDREFHSLIPPLSPEERVLLEKSILADGCRDPLVVWMTGRKHVLIDGHNRHAICMEHGIRYATVAMTFPDRKAATDWIIQNQLARRNLTPLQAAYLRGLRYNTEKKSHGGSRSRPQTEALKTSKRLASAMGVSRATVERDGQLAEAVCSIQKHVGYEAADKILRDGSKLRRADIISLASLPAVIQRHLMQNGSPKAAAIHVEVNRRASTSGRRVVASTSFVITSKLEVISCNCLITDPPYGVRTDQPWEPQDLKSFTVDWAERWNECGADYIAVCWSQKYLFEGREWFESALTGYVWVQMLTWVYRNNAKTRSKGRFQSTWEPVFLFRRKDSRKTVGSDRTNWDEDINVFDSHIASVPQHGFSGADGRVHPTQKPLSMMRWLVAALSEKKDLICDPFAGCGTCGIACLQLGRRYHGIETHLQYRRLAEARISQFGLPEYAATIGQ